MKAKRLHDAETEHYLIDCPGCGCYHAIRTLGPHPVWQFNGDVDKPTFSPSLLVNRSQGNTARPRCHSLIREGRIQFLSDCTHELAGQTVDLPEMDA